MNNYVIFVVNGIETKVSLIETPSKNKTSLRRFIISDFESENVRTYKGGKYFYLNVPEVKEPKQIGRKKATNKKTETKEVSVTTVTNEMIKSKLFDDYISGKITAKDLKEISKQI